MFFFSSRRRHTRCGRDWSSDVCSSDLEGLSDTDKEALYHTIGLGALKYFILKVDPKKRILFDPKESVDFAGNTRSEEHTSELQSRPHLVCRLLLEKKKNKRSETRKGTF